MSFLLFTICVLLYDILFHRTAGGNLENKEKKRKEEKRGKKRKKEEKNAKKSWSKSFSVKKNVRSILLISFY